MSPLRKFLTLHKRGKSKPHTHTWFDNKVPQTLSIPATEVSKLRELVVKDAQTLPSPPSTSPRCITEKVTRGCPFRFFADLDFDADHLKKWKQDNDISEVDFLIRLLQKLRDIIQLYQKVVSKATKVDDVEMILTTRLPYKIHLHFPDIFVNTDGAKAIAKMFSRRFQEEHADIYEETVSDVSVYTTGLRMLYCHKGGMAKAEKKEAENIEHKHMFPTISSCDVYYITDFNTWTQNTTPSLADITKTSIQAAEDVFLTVLHTDTAGKGKGKGKLEKRNTVATEKRDDRNLDSASQVLLGFLASKSFIAQSDIQMDKWSVKGSTFVIPTRARDCLFARRQHSGNQQYFVVTREHAEQRCHDDQCDDSVRYKFENGQVKTAVAELFNALDGGSIDDSNVSMLRTDDDRLSAFRGVITEPIGAKTESAKLNLATANEKMTPMGYWTCTLPQNRYCPVCQATHDRAENFMQVSPLGHRGIGCNLRHGEFYPSSGHAK